MLPACSLGLATSQPILEVGSESVTIVIESQMNLTAKTPIPPPPSSHPPPPLPAFFLCQKLYPI